MNLDQISAVVFSPTGTTKTVLSIMGEALPIAVKAIDITGYSERDVTGVFASNELVLFGVPVYGGRVPAIAVKRIKNMRGDQTPAVLVVTYGNREYDDALLELKNLVEENGFVTVAAAAFVTEHSIMHSVAQGRPDEEDKSEIYKFAQKLWDKMQCSISVLELAVKVNGNQPYREYGGVPLKPQSTKACIKCGICALSCPANAIPVDAPDHTNKDSCISCMCCMKVCPAHARKLNKLMLSVAEAAFAKKNSARKEPTIFIG